MIFLLYLISISVAKKWRILFGIVNINRVGYFSKKLYDKVDENVSFELSRPASDTFDFDWPDPTINTL